MKFFKNKEAAMIFIVKSVIDSNSAKELLFKELEKNIETEKKKLIGYKSSVNHEFIELKQRIDKVFNQVAI